MSATGDAFARKRLLVLLRGLAILACAYVLLRQGGTSLRELLPAAALAVLSEAALALLPRRWFDSPAFGPALLVADAVLILLVFGGDPSTGRDLLVGYFLVLLVVASAESTGHAAAGIAAVSLVYGLWFSHHLPQAARWLQPALVMLIGSFQALLLERLKDENRRRREAEERNRYLHFLLALTRGLRGDAGPEELERSVRAAIERAFPQLDVAVHPEPGTVPADTRRFPRGSPEGPCLAVRARGGRPLTAAEEAACEAVARLLAGLCRPARDAVSSAAGAAFLSAVSHELRTPVHAVLGYAEILDQELGESGPQTLRLYLRRLRANAVRLGELIGEVLQLAELRAGFREIRPRRVDVATVLSEVALEMRAELDRGDAAPACDIATQPAWVVTDPGRLRELLRALLAHALRCAGPAGVRVRVRPGGGVAVEIDIRPPAHPSRALDRWEGDGMGTGLAAALVGELSRLLGAAVRTLPDARGGTRIRLELPAGAAVASGEEVVPAAGRACG